MDFAELRTQDLRLVILRTLEQDPSYTLNESMVHSFAGAIGHNVSRDKIRTEILWLAEQGLLTTKEVIGVVVATLTQRGADVACGRASAPGIKRPSPRNS